MNDFFINETGVDLDRCKLHRDGNTISLEPKVIQVLHFLAQHQGEVVSQKTLLDAIWTNTVVEASALQRCIAQLRKAFQDDARHQQIIATYPKKGYSLVAQVRWQAHEQPNTEGQKRFSGLALAASLLAGIVIVLSGFGLIPRQAATGEIPASPANVAGVTGSSTTETSLLSNPALLAAIGVPEDFPVYSPDGRYVVYARYLEDRKAHLWARDLAYGNDFLLTDKAGDYENLAWSRDGSQLVFVDSGCQPGNNGACTENQCSSLKSVSISQSETNALSVEELIHCSPVKLLAPVWLNSRELVVIEMEAETARLVQYAVKTRERTIVYQSAEVIPYHQSFSRQTNILTIMTIDGTGTRELMFLDLGSEQINKTGRTVYTSDRNGFSGSIPL